MLKFTSVHNYLIVNPISGVLLMKKLLYVLL